MKNIIWVLLILLPFKGFSQCRVKSANEVLSRIKKNHPEIIKNRYRIKFLEKDIVIANQNLNPELDAETSFGDSPGGNVYKTSISLKHTFELGGKKSAREALAKSDLNLYGYQAQEKYEDVILSTVISLHKLRQIYELIPLYEESITSYNKILKRLNRSKSLSPTQEVEKDTLNLAIGDYKLKLSSLISEKINLNKHVAFFMGKDCEINRGLLPINPNFPKNIKNTNIKDYSKLKVAIGEIEKYRAQLKHEKSSAFTNLKIGPSFEYEKDNLDRTTSFGIAVTMDIPIFSTNKGGKLKALEGINSSIKSLALEEKEAILDLSSWKSKYLNSRKSLESVASRNNLEKKHERIESLYQRGIIPTSLVIESHRQLLEFNNSRFKHELIAIEALWNIYKINGDIDEKNI